MAAMLANPRASSVQEVLLFGTGVALAWFCLFHLNNWLFESLSVSALVSWIFLPAAIRMLAVVMFGWAGVLGLFVGSMMTNQLFGHASFVAALTMSVLSAIGPWLAFRTCTKWFGLPDDLSGLRPTHLLFLSAAGALLISVPHCVFFYLSGISSSLFDHMIPMFTGDLIGTLIVLYAAAFLLKLIPTRQISP